MTEVFKVVKLEKGQPVRAYKTWGGEIGAEMERDAYITALAQEFGNPAFVFTKETFLQKLLLASEILQIKMQQTTVAIAAEKVPQP